MRILIALLMILALPVHAQTPCGKDAACEVDEGEYHLVFPPDWDGETPLPALVFYHGHNSSAASIFRSSGLRNSFVNNGYLLIAPNGAFIPGRKVRAWPARDLPPSQRDDVAFTLRVMDDVEKRIPLDTDRIYAGGFSAGGSMVWRMACLAGDRFNAFVSVSGAMRRPNPTDCNTGPIRFLQVHGFADAQVPFEGRGIRDWHQGDLFESFSRARALNSCRTNPDNIEIGETFRCRDWNESCDAGALKMCIHDGGHGLPRGWTDLAKAFFEAG